MHLVIPPRRSTIAVYEPAQRVTVTTTRITQTIIATYSA